jgi:DNA-binding CsgD family transcriptional regulator
LLQSGKNRKWPDTWTVPGLVFAVEKRRVEELATVINDALTSAPALKYRKLPPLLTRQEEKVLTLWMDGASNQKIAAHLSINGKTVYTYKRNIRMKLHMDTRFSPFLSLQEAES